METNKRTDQLQEEALRNDKITEVQAKAEVQELEAIDDFGKIKLIPTPNFTNCPSIGTLIPTNLANDTIRNLANIARKTDLIDFIKLKLGYSTNLKVCASFDSEQIEALTLAITSFEKGNAFILGDMAGIGKGRICAGIMRYAYQQGIIPVFLSFKPYLFNDIFRDLQDIGYFGFDKIDPKKIAMPKPFILHPDGTITNRENPDGPALHAPMSYANINFVCEEITKRANKGKFVMSNPRMGYDFNCVFLPYSTVSMSRTTIKQEFLEAIAPNSLLVFDESHNAASAEENSNILKRTLPLVEKCKGVIFSSATYAKNPDVFRLYIVKTALRTAVPSLESINAALKVGGENVAEYIATGLVYEGQMIRRERSFGNCPKITEYVGARRERDVENNTNRYVNLAGEPSNQRDFYNEAIGYFKELRDFSRSELGKSGIQKAISRKCELQGKQLADDSQYFEMIDNWKAYKNQIIATPDGGVIEIKNKSDVLQAAQKMFIANNRGKWAVVGGLKADNINKYKSTFRENLFLAIKAKFAADKIIECLETPVNYTNFDGSEHITPMKPVVAIKNTAEAIFNELRLEEGQIIRNDFSEYLRAIFKKLFRGKFTLRKITNNFFESKQQLIDRNTWSDSLEITLAYEVNYDDFSDGGAMITAIQSRLNNYSSNLPFSTIDYLIDRIQRQERSRIYYEANNRSMPPKYGEAGGQYYRVGEITAREYMLKRVGDSDEFQFVKNDRLRSATTAFRQFNSGAIDVLLINVVGSTGGSIQSNPKEGIDTRPRNMITIQFEWDINIEVQKRGRVNRTGQLNAPTYTYIISQIPVELRTYLMFRKKLRKLDANTSADQSISAKSSEVVNVEGGVVQDILNVYGFEAFVDNFITLIENEPYKSLYDKFKVTKNTASFAGAAEKNEYSLDKFNDFIRELELYPTNGDQSQVNQEYFFNRMNKIYAEKIELLKTLGKYQLELDTKNYKAKLRGKLVIQLNSGSTIFSKPLFLSDYYTLENKDFLSKDKVEAKISELCKSADGTAITPSEYQSNLVENFVSEANGMLRRFMEIFDEKRPNPANYYTERDRDFLYSVMNMESDNLSEADRERRKQVKAQVEAYNKDLVKFNVERLAEETERTRNFKSIKTFLSYFKPGMQVKYYLNNGKFLGYSIEDTGSRFKYSEGSIIFHFAFLTGIPYAKYRLSSARPILNQIIGDTDDFKRQVSQYGRMFSETTKIEGFLETKRLTLEKEVTAVERWQPQPNRRILRRFLSGNILSGIVYANNYLNRQGSDSGLTTSIKTITGFLQNPMIEWNLTRFTTVDGGFETAIECKYDYELDKNMELKSEDTNLLISTGSSEILSKIKELPYVSDMTYRRVVNFTINVRGTEENIQREGNQIEDLDYQKVVWNGDDNDKGVIPRSVCMYKKEVNSKECLFIEIMNPYRVFQDAKVFYVAPSKNNIIYKDEDLLNKYKSFEIETSGVHGREIYYARFKKNLTPSEAKDLKKVKADEDDSTINLGGKIPYQILKLTYKVFIKTFMFDVEADKRKLSNFLDELHEKYNLSMNFKSSTDLYWFVPTQEDITDISKAKAQQLYPEGEYIYMFENKPDLSIGIPNIIRNLSETELPPYGGAVLKYPIASIQLKPYNLLPYEIPNTIKVQLMLSALTPEDKTLIVKKLQDIKERDAYDIGEFLQEFVEPKTTDMKFFFGDLTVYEYGELIKKYINEEDITQFLVQREREVVPEAVETKQRTIKAAVDLEDAERFLLNLLR